MPKDISTELHQALWDAWFFDGVNEIPHIRDSWASHCADALGMYLMGGEL